MRPIVVMVLGILVLSCTRRVDQAAGGKADTGGGRSDPVADSVRTDSAGIAAPAAELGRIMVGAWDISPQGVPGPHLTISVESADGDRFRGRLTRAFAGNVGLDPGQFRGFTGTLTPDSVARLTIRQAAPGAPPVEIRGKVTGSTWRLSHFLWGGDQQVRTGVTWTGRKVR